VVALLNASLSTASFVERFSLAYRFAAWAESCPRYRFAAWARGGGAL